jgi:hypothetical protein
VRIYPPSRLSKSAALQGNAGSAFPQGLEPGVGNVCKSAEADSGRT